MQIKLTWQYKIFNDITLQNLWFFFKYTFWWLNTLFNNMFFKLLAHQQLINQSGLLQASNLQTSSLQSSLSQQTPVTSQQQQGAANTNAIASYGINPQSLVHSSPTSAGQASVQNSIISNSQIHANSHGQLMFPILQNLNEDVSWFKKTVKLDKRCLFPIYSYYSSRGCRDSK